MGTESRKYEARAIGGAEMMGAAGIRGGAVCAVNDGAAVLRTTETGSSD